MSIEITQQLLQASATEPNVSHRMQGLATLIRKIVANARSLACYGELEEVAADTVLMRFVVDALQDSDPYPCLAHSDFKAYIMYLAYSSEPFAAHYLLNHLTYSYIANRQVEELLFLSDMLHMVSPDRSTLNMLYNIVCGYFVRKRSDYLRDRACRITEAQLRHAERNMPEMGKRTFQIEVELKCLFVYQVKELAQRCNMEYSAFRRKFREIYGMSAGEWIRKQRVEDILYLLRNRELSLAEVASQAGFASVSNFSDFCVRNMNDSPKKLRETL